MKITETASTSFPDAHELPNRNARPVNGHHKASSSNAGSANKKAVPAAPQAVRKRDQEITQENKMIMVIGPTGKRRFVRLADYQQSR